MRVAALDLGSNTSLLMVADLDQSGIVKVLHDETTVTKMGQGVHQERRLHPEALLRMQSCLEKYQRRIHELHVEKVVAVATSAARDVSNSSELIRMGQQLGIPIHVIDGRREADLTLRGALFDQPQQENVGVVDVGGGSTEIIVKRHGVTTGISLDIGSVRLTELLVRHHPTPQSELDQVREYIQSILAKHQWAAYKSMAQLVAVAGTPTTLAGLAQGVPFSESKIHGYTLTVVALKNWITRLAGMTVGEREMLPGMQPKRADVIVTGTQILLAVLEMLGFESALVSTKGVRFGVALAWQEFS